MSEKSHSVRSNAVRSARRVLGREAKQGVDFIVSGDKSVGYTWSPVEGAAPVAAPVEVEAAPVAATSPVKVKRIKSKVKAKVAAAKVGRKPLRRADEVSGKRLLMFSLISSKNGASLDTLTRRLDWQKHTVRGAISTIGSQFGVKIKSYRNERGQRIYRATNKGKTIAA